ncbi:heme-thiolate peroxidase [Punctularia strigosozonata HHB-11173 SS5]|uniref:Heme-thiolate peroxidase n=1 Tax=Punctularia strigosozonata (strain HHB-11173) TaxID=741275 RepID=R7S4R3_PUNST|nr:heme-thiolate peroxidase [Punctularia strigosozonata HHB-11173 SS5]EIN04231.1 heme-thiolate peroxidase [Punctularia strigosozonata HHB-11173 SS5]
MLTIYTALIFLSVAFAQSPPEWIPASQISGAVRSPCPGLNTLANHGFLPRDGKSISIPTLVTACQDGLNVGADFCTVIGTTSLLSNGAIAKGGLIFDLDDLNEHNFPIEHDASVSREDAFFGDNHDFNTTIFQTLNNSAVNGFYTTETAGLVRQARLEDSVARNPNITWLAQHALIAYGEAALYLSVMSAPIIAMAPQSFVNMLFEQEKLPFELGWKPSVVQTNFATLAATVAQILVFADDEQLEVAEITESEY